ncbi:MAG: Flp pilus assembly complex ATPase component TadA [Chloroflexi bacterium]|nr:Flp pilus assembly complex ATPase component TadA [Chloroflexota bacterium]
MVATSETSFEQRVARVLVDGGFITAKQLEQARELAQAKKGTILDILVSEGMLTRETLATVLSVQLRVPVVDLRFVEIDPEAVRLLPEDYARQHQVLPYEFAHDGSLRVATLTPNNFSLGAELASVTGRQVRFAFALGEGLASLIDRTYAPTLQPGQSPVDKTKDAGPAGLQVRDVSAQDMPATLAAGAEAGQMSAVQTVEMVTLQAVKRRASDIHLVPISDSSKVLFRIDGTLHQMIVLTLQLHESMISRIKVLSGMDIAERRRPQDGSFTMTFGEKRVDFRVSSIGTGWGEMMVIRVLDRSGGLLALSDVGLDSIALHTTKQLLGLPYGMFLVSGPTGSGKTTTLYAAISDVAQERGNTMAIEDPIEYRMESVHQIEVNRPAGIDFAAGLRSIMRLDPDVILVGEIRDAETARIAVDAALTGHLVLASIHGNDAASSIVRLLELSGDANLVAASVIGALTQRLVRKVCPRCRELTDLTDAEAITYEQEMQEPAGQLYAGKGCNFCGGIGFTGRTGVFEVLPVRVEIREMIARRATAQQIKERALAEGMIPLLRAGLIKAKAGATTVGEVLRNVFTIE